MPPLSEDEELELLELEEEEYQHSQQGASSDANSVEHASPETGAIRNGPVAGAVDVLRPSNWQMSGPRQSVWQSVKDRFTKMDPSAKAALNGPLGYMAGPEAGGALLANTMRVGAEGVANSKTLGKIADYTDVAGMFGKVSNWLKPAAKAVETAQAPLSSTGGILNAAPAVAEAAAPVAQSASIPVKELFSRGAAYVAPGPLKYVQGTSDAIRGTQKGLQFLFENHPEKLGNLYSLAKKTISQGPEAVKTIEFILSQRSPEFQKAKKDASNEQ